MTLPVPPFRIITVCTGNICRSPIAEAVLTRALDEAGLDCEVSSAGTGGWHVGDDADPRALRVLNEAGYPLTHAARKFEPQWLDDADLVLALDHSHLADLRRLGQRHGIAHDHVRLLRSFDPAMAALDEGDVGLDVEDPYYGPDQGFITMLDQVRAAATGVVQFVRSNRT